MTDKHKELKAFIKKNYGSQDKFAEFLGYARETVAYKLNNQLPFTVEDIQRIKDKHNLTPNQVILFFFNK